MARTISKFESLPLEVRTLVYKELFGRNHILVWRHKRRKENAYDTSHAWNSLFRGEIKRTCILSTSRQIYHEAVAVLASCLTLELETRNLDTALFAWQRRYYALIRTLSVPTTGKVMFNATDFSSLRVLNLCSAYGEDFSLRASLPAAADLRYKVLFSGADEKLKVERKRRIQTKLRWFKKLLKQTIRQFEVRAMVKAEWMTQKVFDSKPYYWNERLEITFNLDTMATVRREAFYWQDTDGDFPVPKSSPQIRTLAERGIVTTFKSTDVATSTSFSLERPIFGFEWKDLWMVVDKRKVDDLEQETCGEHELGLLAPVGGWD
jgi:hypothetical protein